MDDYRPYLPVVEPCFFTPSGNLVFCPPVTPSAFLGLDFGLEVLHSFFMGGKKNQTQKAEMLRVDALYDAELAHLRKLWAGAAPGSWCRTSWPA